MPKLDENSLFSCSKPEVLTQLTATFSPVVIKYYWGLVLYTLAKTKKAALNAAFKLVANR
ncbi:hypothetical protein PCARR_a3398 [Pseudoalteromonas carrageenovora IAM 12662]|uniref:Uncharacterized protein n=1 Tax=Pseudoalteromonas carrageenovora IAM 12662 TaxID=1314868 RepID=A0A2K4X5B6_PSEVC|nr:hypothetical protein [Pseudoalteromonas carrageenovora IAM 12662]GEB70483.1 hypothetical protein PCA01_11930 [Pseudoalteromonas carrageenovora]SOU39521.1 protein of unknown function [Pseudoalteromonas carrageenovora IAM 12662]